MEINDIEEVWKDIEGYESLYQISNVGRVKSLQRTCLTKGNKYRIVQERILKLFIIKGYYYINLNKNGILNQFRVNVLVGKHFVDNPFNLPQLNHDDGVKLNNVYTNLIWCTASENGLHAVQNGLKPIQKGDISPNHKLNSEQVNSIRQELANGINGRTLSKKYNMSEGMISMIKHNKNWI
jgi:hypothetical protein